MFCMSTGRWRCGGAGGFRRKYWGGSHEEKLGMQAIGNAAPDLPPVPGRHGAVSRDYECKRHGTLSHRSARWGVLGLVGDRHRSAEFVEFLQQADEHYPAGRAFARCRIIIPLTSGKHGLIGRGAQPI